MFRFAKPEHTVWAAMSIIQIPDVSVPIPDVPVFSG
jgi:hypothetical protein